LRLVYEVARNKGRLWIFIDEYDRFANKLMLEAPEKYNTIITGNSGIAGSSYIRTFFETLKTCSTLGAKDFRVFITGITPVALADAFGYNVAKDITLDEDFGDVVGFTEKDLLEVLQKTKVEQNKVIEAMKHYYNGYSFPGCTASLYNPTLSLFFLNKYHTKEKFRKLVFDRKLTLEHVIDDNVKMSENILKLLSTVPVTKELIQNLSNEQLPVYQKIITKFKFRELQEIVSNSEQISKQKDLVASFLYYHGVITGQFDYFKEKVEIRIPNEIGRSMFLVELQKTLAL
jgi:hypothetical protein